MAASSSSPSTSNVPRDTWATAGTLTSFCRYRSPAICQIVIYDKEDPLDDDSGTGCLIGNNLIITNNHVIPSKKVAETARIFFYYDALSDRRGTQYDVIPISLNPHKENKGYFYTSPSPGKNPLNEHKLDFTIVALNIDPKLKEISERAFSIFDIDTPQKGTIGLIGHPGGTDPNRSLEGAKVCEIGEIKEVKSQDIHYFAKTDAGFSGAPILNFKGKLVGIHRIQPLTPCNIHGKECRQGISATAILKHLSEEREGKAEIDQIKRYLSDHPLTTNSPTILYLPKPPTNFTGRKDELSKLKDLGETKNRIAVIGTGGVGKTALVLQYVQDNQERYDYIHLIRAGKREMAIEGLLDLANDLNILKFDKDADKRLRNLRVYLEREERKFLLIVDGIDHPEVFKFLSDFLPETKGTLLLLTSCAKGYPGELGFASLVIHPMKEEEAVEFLLTANDTDINQARLLAKELGYLPLALKQATAYIKNHNDYTFEKYLGAYKKWGVQLFENGYSDLSKDEKTILTTWTISLNTIENYHKCSLAKELLKYFSFLSPSPIPLELIKQWGYLFTDDDPQIELELENALMHLENYSLIEREEKSYFVHILTQKVTRYQLSEGAKKIWLGRSAGIFCKSLTRFNHDPEYSKTRKLLIPYLPHLETLLDLLRSNYFDTPAQEFLTNTLFGYYFYSGNYLIAYELAEKSLKLIDEFIEELAEKEANSAILLLKCTNLSRLGIVLDALGESRKALDYLNKILEITKNWSKKKHANLFATVYGNIGGALINLGDIKEGLKYKLLDLKLKKKFLNENPLALAWAYNNAGYCLNLLGEHLKALKHLLKALDLFQKNSEQIDSIDATATCLSNIGLSFANLGEFDEALKYNKLALQIRQLVLERTHPELLLGYALIGKILIKQKDYAEAIKFLFEALKLVQEAQGKENLNAVEYLVDISFCFKHLKKHETAMNLLFQAQNIIMKKGPNHSNLLKKIFYDIIDNFAEWGRIGETLQAISNLFKMKFDIFGDDVFQLGSSYKQIGNSLRKLNTDEIIDYFQKNLASKIEELGESHPQVAEIHSQLGIIMESLGDHENAHLHLSKALEIRTEIFNKTKASNLNIAEYISAATDHKTQWILLESINPKNMKKPRCVLS